VHETLMSLTLTAQIKQAARDLGFDVVGVARLSTQNQGDPFPEPHTSPASLLARLTAWLQRGFHATMAWMARDPQRRADPARVLPGCRSIISVAMNYYTDDRADERQGNGRIARYAWGRDYTRSFDGDGLRQLASAPQYAGPRPQHRAYVDTGPVMEKAWAQQAGLGWIGKHSNLVSHRLRLLASAGRNSDDRGAGA
jgi:epoxyqueuosine reductase